MNKQTLEQKISAAKEFGLPFPEVPNIIKNNLNPLFQLRPYQIEAFSRFIFCMNNPQIKQKPAQLLFHMATGSGKTLIMAGTILYLHQQGYRNFIFFVNSTNIINKTRDNFLNPLSIKYLFSENITYGDKKVSLKEVENFQIANQDDINIENELRICEELYYHSAYNPRYIQELNTALQEIGIKAKESREIQLTLKLDFKESEIYKSGIIFLNEQLKNDRTEISTLPTSIIAQLFEEKYSKIYLVRNEKYSQLYNFDDGRAMEPDFRNPPPNFEMSFEKWYTRRFSFTQLKHNYFVGAGSKPAQKGL